MNPRTNELPLWQLVVAGPDEQGTLARLKAQAERLGLNVNSQPLTVNSKRSTLNREEIRDGEQEWEGDKRPTAYSSPFTDLLFIGPVYGEEKARVMADADLFVLPTRSENFGLAVAEALACGVPVITTKGAPWQELLGDGENVNGKRLTVSSKPLCVESNPLSRARYEGCQQFTVDRSRFTDFTDNGRCGWWIDVGVEPLVEALREAMSLTDEERRAMGKNGRRLVDSKYRWETVAERMSAVYSGIVNCKP